MQQGHLTIKTQGRGITDVTSKVADRVARANVKVGLCHLFLQHTSASLILCENYDPQVHRDLESFMQHTVRDGDPMFRHTAEGPDDMPAHVRTVLTHSDLTIPITDGALALGTWQGISLWEHRTAPHTRRVIVTVMGG